MYAYPYNTSTEAVVLTLHTTTKYTLHDTRYGHDHSTCTCHREARLLFTQQNAEANLEQNLKENRFQRVLNSIT